MSTAIRRQHAVTSNPCAKCPFRKDVPIYLRADRRQEIADAIFDGGDFSCHATVSYWEDDDGECADTTDARICAGAVKALELCGGSMQMMRIAERLGGVREGHHPADSEVEVWDLNDWMVIPEGATADTEVPDILTCETVGPYCLAPAGYLTLSGAAKVGTEEADDECAECGSPTCPNCLAEDGRCGNCADDEDDWR